MGGGECGLAKDFYKLILSMHTKDEKVDACIVKLLEVRGKKPGKNVQLTEDEIKHLCTKSREILIS